MDKLGRTPSHLLAVIALCALAVACSKTQQQPAPFAATSQPAPEFGSKPTPPPTAAQGPSGALATGGFGGPDPDQSQTAAVSPMSRPSGTTPASPGVGPPGGYTLSKAPPAPR